jgi:hypothetical protein
MRRAVAAAVLLALLAALSPAGAEEKGAKSPGPPEDKASPDADRLVHVGVVAGVVQDVSSRGTLNLKVTLRYLEPNPKAQAGYAERYQQLFARQQAILANRNPAQQQQQLAQLLRDAEGLLASQKDLFHVKEMHKDVELSLSEQVKVRAAVPPHAFDDKGNIKRYTAKDLKEMRGTDRLPGFAAELSDIQPGQTVLVKLAVRKKAPARKRSTKEAPSESQRDAPPPAPDDNRPQVYLVLILDPMG